VVVFLVMSLYSIQAWKLLVYLFDKIGFPTVGPTIITDYINQLITLTIVTHWLADCKKTTKWTSEILEKLITLTK